VFSAALRSFAPAKDDQALADAKGQSFFPFAPKRTASGQLIGPDQAEELARGGGREADLIDAIGSGAIKNWQIGRPLYSA